MATPSSSSELLANLRDAFQSCGTFFGTDGPLRQLNQTLRERLANWNPDWEDETSLAGLDTFGRAHPDAVEPARKYIFGMPETFGRALYHALDLRLRTPGVPEDFIDFVRALSPFVVPGKGELSDAFWRALRRDAKSITERRLREARPRSLFGVTPINVIQTFAEADRVCGIQADALVFSTYYITSDFDVLLSSHEHNITTLAPECFVAFRWLVLTWVLLRYDFINLYNDRGIIEPAGGYGSDRFGISLAEMDLYRQTGKTFYTRAYGADYRGRQRTLASGKWNTCMDCPEPGKFCVCDDAGSARMLREIARRATSMLATGLGLEQDSRFAECIWAGRGPYATTAQ